MLYAVFIFMKNKESLTSLFRNYFGILPENIHPLPGAGSDRSYFRLTGKTQSAIGVVGTDETENRAFLTYTRHFSQQGLPVPALYAVSDDQMCYLLEDLGDDALFDILLNEKEFAVDSNAVIFLKRALCDLSRFQTEGHLGLDYSVAFASPSFDIRTVMWDLNYFKYCFLKPLGIVFSEDLLENEFETLAQRCISLPSDFFMFRDFQSRNIMIAPRGLRYIDYQGGRRGPRAYDVVSLLWQARAAIPQKVREELVEYYISVNEGELGQSDEAFRKGLSNVALLRTLQVLGAYGFRGMTEKKLHFIKSIPPAMDNLRSLLGDTALWKGLPHLRSLAERLCAMPRFSHAGHHGKLRIHLSSFSYKKGYPDDPGLNGGGFVFDCRALPNPGRLQQYKHLTGMDKPVIDYLQQYPQVEEFVQHASAMVCSAVDNYLDRGFSDLSAGFGCTGGQHRSVYCAEQLSAIIDSRYNVEIILTHREQ